MTESQEEIRARLQAQIRAMEQGGGESDPVPAGKRSRRAAPQAAEAGEGTAVRKRQAARSDKGAPKDADAAFAKIVRLASTSEQATRPLKERLLREGYPESAADAAIGRAVSCGLVDDSRYAEVLVRSRLSQGRGRPGIRAELERLGLDAQSCEPVFEECEQSELERALDLLDARPPRAKNKRDACYRRLVSKGYSSDVASSASRRWCEFNCD